MGREQKNLHVATDRNMKAPTVGSKTESILDWHNKEIISCPRKIMHENVFEGPREISFRGELNDDTPNTTFHSTPAVDARNMLLQFNFFTKLNSLKSLSLTSPTEIINGEAIHLH